MFARLLALVITVVALVGMVRPAYALADDRPAPGLTGSLAAGEPDDADAGVEATVPIADTLLVVPAPQQLLGLPAASVRGRVVAVRLFRPPRLA